jgi:hypothetical protein
VDNIGADVTAKKVLVYAAEATGDAAPIRNINLSSASPGGLPYAIAIDKPRPVANISPSLNQVLQLVATMTTAGVSVDGGGIVFVGGIPIPVGPWGELSPGMLARRDVLIGLAIEQFASAVRQPAGQSKIREAALELVLARVNELLTSIS